MSITVPSSGPLDARFAILGESPGQEEERELKPFVGASGKVLEGAIGIERSRIYITNVRKHRPPETQSKKERLAEIAHEHPSLCDEFSRLKSLRCLQIVGADALRSTLGTSEISRFHGSFFTRAEAEALRSIAADPASLIPLPATLHTVAVTLHPAFALRGNLQFKGEIQQVMARALRWSIKESGPTRPKRDLFDLECDLDALLHALKQATTVCIDVETPKEGKGIDLCGFGVPDGRVWVAAWSHEVGEVVQMLMSSVKAIVGHNLLFDLRRFIEMGVVITNKPLIVDTIAGGALLWPPPPQSKQKRGGKKQTGPSRLSLAACACRLLDGWYNWKKWETPESEALYRCNYPSLRKWQIPRVYNAWDVHSNLKMWWPMRELLRREGML